MAGLLWYRSYMDSLANTSGYYPDIHAGHADRTSELTLTVPYLSRSVPSGYNQLELAQIIGGTMVVEGSLQSVEATSHVSKDGHGNVISTTTFDSVTLRGITETVDGILSYDGDTYDPDGTITRKYAEVIYDGSSDENWQIAANYNGSNFQHTFFRIQNVPNMKTYSGSTADYVKNMEADWAEPMYVPDGIVDNHWTMRRASGSQIFYVLSPTSDGAVSLDTFKAKLAATPLHVVYELATQTTESADPYTAVQTVEDGGTVEFVTSNNIPVGNVSIYRRV